MSTTDNTTSTTTEQETTVQTDEVVVVRRGFPWWMIITGIIILVGGYLALHTITAAAIPAKQMVVERFRGKNKIELLNKANEIEDSGKSLDEQLDATKSEAEKYEQRNTKINNLFPSVTPSPAPTQTIIKEVVVQPPVVAVPAPHIPQPVVVQTAAFHLDPTLPRQKVLDGDNRTVTYRGGNDVEITFDGSVETCERVKLMGQPINKCSNALGLGSAWDDFNPAEKERPDNIPASLYPFTNIPPQAAFMWKGNEPLRIRSLRFTYHVPEGTPETPLEFGHNTQRSLAEWTSSGKGDPAVVGGAVGTVKVISYQ